VLLERQRESVFVKSVRLFVRLFISTSPGSADKRVLCVCICVCVCVSQCV